MRVQWQEHEDRSYTAQAFSQSLFVQVHFNPPGCSWHVKGEGKDYAEGFVGGDFSFGSGIPPCVHAAKALATIVARRMEYAPYGNN